MLGSEYSDILDSEFYLLMDPLNLLVREHPIHRLSRYPGRDQKTDPSLRVREKRTASKVTWPIYSGP